MTSKKEFVKYIVAQMGESDEIIFKSMFGEYGLYCDQKMFALVSDDRLFFKPTEGGRIYMKDVKEASPYPGAKPWLLVEDQVEDSDWLSELVRITVAELPEPKPKKRKNNS